MVAFIVVRGGATGNWSDAVHDVTEVFKIGVLPIVTLVIGHYFGRGERR